MKHLTLFVKPCFKQENKMELDLGLQDTLGLQQALFLHLKRKFCLWKIWKSKDYWGNLTQLTNFLRGPQIQEGKKRLLNQQLNQLLICQISQSKMKVRQISITTLSSHFNEEREAIHLPNSLISITKLLSKWVKQVFKNLVKSLKKLLFPMQTFW